jgi:hypothetical protein
LTIQQDNAEVRETCPFKLLSNVDLPAPFGPTSVVISPALSVSVTFDTATRSL